MDCVPLARYRLCWTFFWLMRFPDPRNLFIRKDGHIDSWPVYKRVILTGYLALLTLMVAVYYIIFDWIQGDDAYFYIYTILIVAAAFCIFLLRRGFYTLGKFFLLTAALSVVGIFSSAEPVDTGIDLYYITICMGCLALFDFEKIWVGISLCILTIAVFIAIEITGVQFIPEVQVYNDSMKTVFISNFFICILGVILIIYYLMSTNYYSENEMKKTERNLIQLTEELAESRRKFELAIRGSSAGIWDWNLKTNKLYISPQMMKMLGHEPRERSDIEEEEFMSRVHPDDEEKLNQQLKRHLRHRERFEVECRIKQKSGDYIWVLDTGQAEWDENGEEVRMVGSIVDITERKMAEREVNEKNAMLRKTNNELDRFVYSTSHDLKAPLSSLLGLINIAEITDDPEEQRRCLNLMKERVETLNGFIADIISYSRNTRLDVIEEDIDLSQMVDQILENLEYFENRKELRIEKEIEEKLSLKCDSSRLRVILNNLIANAIKYHNLNQEDPFIRISAKTEDGFILIGVEDNGKGIDESYKDKIFEMFYRASESSEGSGLGLYIAREMTDKLNGQLSVDTVLGQGSTFTIILPQKIKLASAN